MAWPANSAWHSEATHAARLTKLRLHMGDLEAELAHRLSSGGRQIDSEHLQKQYVALQANETRLEKLAAAESAADGSKRPIKFHALQFTRPV